MPNDAVTERIMSRAEALLASIGGGYAYHNVVQYVGRVQSSTPTITVWPTIELYMVSDLPDRTIGYGSVDLYNAKLTWHAVGYVNDPSNPQLAASRIAQDIRTAIESEQAMEDLDGSVMVKDTQWIGTTIALMSTVDGAAFADVGFETQYMVQRTDTSVYT